MSDAVAAAPQAGHPDRLWDDWAELARVSVGEANGMPPEGAPPRVPEAPELHLDGFDGPLDLLLDLAEGSVAKFWR